MLLINRYTCPINNSKVFIQAHQLDDNLNIVQSFGKMSHDNISLFNDYNNVLIVDVVRSAMLSVVNVAKEV